MIKRLLIISALTLLTVASAATVCAEDNGYIFELKDGAVVPMSVTEGVERICDEKAVYKADSLADIYSFVSPSAIENLGRNIPVYLFDDAEYEDYTGTNDEFANYQWNIKQIKMPKVWAKGYRGEGATVCVIDSGLNLEHNDLDVKRVVGKYNIFDGSDDVTDSIGHGTLVTGVINAVTNNGKGIAGIADKSDIVVVKAFDDESSGEHKTDVTTLISALEYVARSYPEVDVINMSLGTADNMDEGTKQIFQKAIDEVVDKGIIVVAAVGNDGSSRVSYPAGFDNVIGVGGTTKEDVKCSFSQYNNSVFVCAPGGNNNSSDTSNPPFVTLGNNGSDVVTTRGTSFSAPQVSAVAAIAKSIYPELTTNQFKEILKKTSEDLTEVPPYFDKETVLEQFGDLKGYDEFYGYGLIDADKIIEETEKLAEKAPFEYNADNYRVLEYINDGEEKCVVVETDDLNASVYIASYDDNVLSSVRRVDISDLESGTDDSNNYCRYQIPISENEAEPSKLFLWHGMIGCKAWEMQTAE